MKVGYARVSTPDQSLASQTDALKSAGCVKVFTDVASGKNTKRKGLEECMSYLRAGDHLVVWKLDRLGRSIKDLIEFINGLDTREIQFASLTEGINTTTPGGKFFFHVLAAFAEMERELIRERTEAGLKAARARGRLGGRPKGLTDSQATTAWRLFDEGTPYSVLKKQFGVSPQTFRRHWNRLGLHAYKGAG